MYVCLFICLAFHMDIGLCTNIYAYKRRDTILWQEVGRRWTFYVSKTLNPTLFVCSPKRAASALNPVNPRPRTPKP